MKETVKQLLNELKPVHIDREISMSTEAFDALKNAQRRFSYELGQEVSANKTYNLILLHYGKLMQEGKL